MSCIQDRPKNTKKLAENIELYRPEGDFSTEEKIDYVSSLTGIFPFNLVMTREIRQSIERHCVPALGNWDNDLGVAWFVPREIIPKKTKNDKLYWLVKVTDETSANIHINRPYAAKLDYSEDWGFSTRSIRHNFKLLG